MNEFLQNNLFTIIVFLLFIILLLIGILSYVVFALLAQHSNHSSKQQPELKAHTIEQKIHLEAPVVEKFSCHIHPEESTAGSCLICEDVFCDKCLVEHEGMFFCKQHFKTYANYKWKQITDFKTSAKHPEDGLFIYKYKRMIWEKKEMPSYVLTHYKINVEEDTIESYIQLHVREEDVDEFSKGLSELIQ